MHTKARLSILDNVRRHVASLVAGTSGAEQQEAAELEKQLTEQIKGLRFSLSPKPKGKDKSQKGVA